MCCEMLTTHQLLSETLGPTIQSVLHSAISKQQLTASRYVTLEVYFHTQLF